MTIFYIREDQEDPEYYWLEVIGLGSLPTIPRKRFDELPEGMWIAILLMKCAPTRVEFPFGNRISQDEFRYDDSCLADSVDS